MQKIVITVAAIVAVAVATASSGMASVRSWERGTIDGDFEALVLLDGCDGLIAAGGETATIPGGPASYSHNFIASLHADGWWKSDPTVANSLVMRERITGAATDAASQTFTLEGALTQDQYEADFYADDGMVTVRRADGAFARGSASGAYGIVFQGVFPYVGNYLVITASHCQLRPSVT